MMKSNKLSNDLSIESESEYYFDDQFNVPFDANLKNRNDKACINDFKYRESGNMSQSLSESCIYSDMGSSFQEFPDVLDEILEHNNSGKRLFSPSQSISEIDPKISMNKSNTSNIIINEILSKCMNRDYRITFDDKKKYKAETDIEKSSESTVTWNQLNHGKNVSLLKNKSKFNVTNSSSCSNINENCENKVMSWNILKNSIDSPSNNLLNNTNKRSRSLLKKQNSDEMKKSTDSRARSEPRGSLKLSSTLFEIYTKSKGNKDSNFENAFIMSQKVNFGAQFPPIYNTMNNQDYHSRNRSNSFDKKLLKYPGLGRINIPKGTRLNECALLSKTLPDLSFLSNSDKISSTMQKKTFASNTFKDSGFDSSGFNDKTKGKTHLNPAVTNDLIILDEENNSGLSHLLSVPNFQDMDLLTGSPCRGSKRVSNDFIDRSISEPNFGILKDVKSINQNDNINSVSSNESENEMKFNKPKKSVSFSEKTLTKPLSPIRLFNSSVQLFTEYNVPQAIPRSLGLYGNESNMVSEFTLESQIKSSRENELSNEDLKYKILVKDIIKAIQTIVNSFVSNSTLLNSKISMLIDPFYSLLTDGILPYQRNIVSLKSRYRLWNVIESSCSNDMEVYTKNALKIPINNEKGRFRCFITYLINEKQISYWFKSLIKNESLLKNNYSKESFLRQTGSKMKGLYADLDTNLQLLDNNSCVSIKPGTISNRIPISHVKSVASVKSLKKNNSNTNSSESVNVSRTKVDLRTSPNNSLNTSRSFIPARKSVKPMSKSKL